jgi:hypothetical protein
MSQLPCSQCIRHGQNMWQAVGCACTLQNKTKHNCGSLVLYESCSCCSCASMYSNVIFLHVLEAHTFGDAGAKMAQ